MIQGNRLLVKMFTSQLLQSADQAYGVSHPAFAGARLRVGVLLRSQKNHTAYRVLFSGGSRPSAMARRRLMGNCREKKQLNVHA
jgi:hypothetical protein